MTLNHFISFWAALYYRVLPDVIKEFRFIGVKLCDLIGIAKSLVHRCAAFTDAKMSLCARASDAFGQPETDNSELPIKCSKLRPIVSGILTTLNLLVIYLTRSRLIYLVQFPL